MPPLVEPYMTKDESLKPDYELRSLPSVMRNRIKNVNDVAKAVSSAVVVDICGIPVPAKPTGGAGSEPPAAAKPTSDP